ncbi:MAG: ubiquinol-cytochrome C chaperone family protein [Magnetospirillum sp. WYHS-4]
MILHLFRQKNPLAGPASALYAAAVAQARRPEFYGRGGVPDSLDGRFDMVALQVYLLLRRLKRDGESAAPLSQALFDRMFEDMDHNLREIGVGDLVVGKRIKEMAKAFYGRIAAYDRGLAEGGASLGEALRRNLFRGTLPQDVQVAAVARYLATATAALEAQTLADLMAGRAAFPPFEGDIP